VTCGGRKGQDRKDADGEIESKHDGAGLAGSTNVAGGGRLMPVMRSAVKKYVEEMGITDSFFERMFNTDPSAIAIYRGDESEKIVPFTDPTHDEIVTSQVAQQYGVTTLEYRRRKSLAESCSMNDKFMDCYEPIMWGLSPDVYRSRSAMVKIRCDAGLSESEKEHFNATPRKDRILLPFAVRIYACRVNTMLAK